MRFLLKYFFIVVGWFFGASLLFLGPTSAEGNTFEWPVVHGYIKNETAVRTASDTQLTKSKNILYLSSIYPITPDITLHVAGRFFYDATFSLTNHYNEVVREDQEHEAALRQAYVHASMGNLDLKLGKQQIVWGEAVGGLFVADVVNPKDLREFILPDPAEIRIPVWAANIEYFLQGIYLQAVWLPIVEFNDLPEPGTEFYEYPVGFSTTARSRTPREPPRTLGNSAVGIRLSRMIHDWDLGAFYLYTYDYFPTRFLTLTPSLLIIEPSYRRLHILGGTFSKPVGETVFKGEMVLNLGKYFSTHDPMDSRGVTKKNSLDYLLALDRTIWGRLDCNVQWLQHIVLDHESSLIEKKTRSYVSTWFKTDFLDGRLEPEFFFVFGLDRGDLLLRPKMSFRWGGRWKVTVGMDVFEGSSDGDFGRFDSKDRVYAEISRSF
ncbi:hypothetical protein SAMN02745206_03571 [Desulfacinum infernum DSM 9756]|uniref:Beta-barrel porin-2, OmpL-like. bbp2 n=1 Tax=Desulfacinum infernum DSM 9756 TaxID=1121391 RepID=A0A1M5IDP0_9BACT|nr:DUF1302 family protein [Desulfacinum infernum]SHG26189.1 hypothetical protein SAMN02745206_03571 [Desulfacinum infernum DSM 9756]